jgi:GNAT superfamily N-acetyltransferase
MKNDFTPDDAFIAAVGIRLRACRREDLVALEWMGLFTRDRDLIRTTFDQQRAGAARMLLAIANDFPIAQVWLDFAQRGCAECPCLWALRVFPPLRGLGIGTWLITAAEHVARNYGATDIELGVERGNSSALRMYARLGYRSVGPRIGSLVGCPGVPPTDALDLQVMRKPLLCG